MEGVLATFARRRTLSVGLVLAAAWIAVVAVECFAVYPWDSRGWYASTLTFADFAWKGVVGVAAFVWLFDRAAA